MKLRRIILLVFGAALLTALVAGPASAHRGEQAYLYLDVAEDDLAGRVELPYTDVREVFGLSLEGSWRNSTNSPLTAACSRMRATARCRLLGTKWDKGARATATTRMTMRYSITDSDHLRPDLAMTSPR